MTYRYAVGFRVARGMTDADVRRNATRFRSTLRFRKLAAAAAVCFILAFPAGAQAANWSAGSAYCSSGSISISSPTAGSTTTDLIWWYPQILELTDAGWAVAYSPGYFWATREGAITSIYQAYQGGSVVGMDRPLIISVTPGRSYAVYNWLYDGGWAPGWSSVDYPTNPSLFANALICPA